jgi:cobalt-zinc-cadmium efflux system outer membrane protein
MMQAPIPSATSIPIPSPVPGAGDPSSGGQNISMQAALYGAVTGNPDLVALRNSNIASPEAVEVARQFPATLNPTLWIEIRPWTIEPNGSGHGYHQDDIFLYFSLRQPIELGHQTRYRHAIAQAAWNQQQWIVVQAELLALVQTYRFFETAAYRREKLHVARQLAEFNEQLVQSLKKRLEANQVQAADVVLAEVESQATSQLVEAARQDYANALTDLRNQIGIPETAGTAEPLGKFTLPAVIPALDEPALIELAIKSRPEIRAARAQADGALAALNLAKGDRIPTPIVGPVYERDEQKLDYWGFVYVTPIPIWNNGKPLVIQREAEYRRALVALQQVEQRTVAQVKAATAKWNGASRLIRQSTGLTESLKMQVAQLERLFDANQTDLTKLLQARQRLIQLENAELDALWQATQAQADLLTALGAPSLLASLQKFEQASSAGEGRETSPTAPGALSPPAQPLVPPR